MDPNWNDSQPIYRQLRDRVVEMILEDVLGDGDALPSVRSVAAEYRLNPLTVLKGYQELVDEGLVEKKRGRGMFIKDGARTTLLKDERKQFVSEQWPAVVATIRRLGLDLKELLEQAELHSRVRVREEDILAVCVLSRNGGRIFFEHAKLGEQRLALVHVVEVAAAPGKGLRVRAFFKSIRADILKAAQNRAVFIRPIAPHGSNDAHRRME